MDIMFHIVKKIAAVLVKPTKSKETTIKALHFLRRGGIPHRSCSSGSTTRRFTNEDQHNVECKDIKIPVPYGHISAKAWGRNNGVPVLAFHGWLDNCGTFDKLIPLLSNDLYIVAVDAPGHGLSSHKPPGCMYRDIDLLVDFKRVFDFMGWHHCNIIGHSMGGGLALMFSCLFPDAVRKLVVLDLIKPTSRSVERFPEETTIAISEYMKIENKLTLDPPVYTLEKAIARLMEGMFNEITQDSAKILIKRGTKLSDHSKDFIFTRDLRCRTIEMLSRVSHQQMKRCMENVKCELLMILANNTHKNYKTATPEVTEDFIDIYRSNCKRFILKTVEGNHFVHLNDPENVAPLIDEFFSKRSNIE